MVGKNYNVINQKFTSSIKWIYGPTLLGIIIQMSEVVYCTSLLIPVQTSSDQLSPFQTTLFPVADGSCVSSLHSDGRPQREERGPLLPDGHAQLSDVGAQPGGEG